MTMAANPLTVVFANQTLPLYENFSRPIQPFQEDSEVSPDGKKSMYHSQSSEYYNFVISNGENGKETVYSQLVISDFLTGYDAITFSDDSNFAYYTSSGYIDYDRDGPFSFSISRFDLNTMSSASIYSFTAYSSQEKLSDDRMSFVVDIGLSNFASPTQAVAVNVASGAVFDLNTSASGEKGNGTISETHTVNGGKFVAFVSTSSNLVAGDTNGVADVFLRNIQTGEVTLVSKSAAGVQGNGVSGGLDVSADGSKLLFHSDASNLVSGDANGFRDVFVRDIATGQVASAQLAPMAVGFLVSGVSGYLVIGGLLAWLRRGSLIGFAVYRIVLGAIIGFIATSIVL